MECFLDVSNFWLATSLNLWLPSTLKAKRSWLSVGHAVSLWHLLFCLTYPQLEFEWLNGIYLHHTDNLPIARSLIIPARSICHESNKLIRPIGIWTSLEEGCSLFLPLLSLINLLLLSTLFYIKMMLHIFFSFFISWLLTFSGSLRNSILVYHALHFTEDFLHPGPWSKIHTRACYHFKGRLTFLLYSCMDYA